MRATDSEIENHLEFHGYLGRLRFSSMKGEYSFLIRRHNTTVAGVNTWQRPNPYLLAFKYSFLKDVSYLSTLTIQTCRQNGTSLCDFAGLVLQMCTRGDHNRNVKVVGRLWGFVKSAKSEQKQRCGFALEDQTLNAGGSLLSNSKMTCHGFYFANISKEWDSYSYRWFWLSNIAFLWNGVPSRTPQICEKDIWDICVCESLMRYFRNVVKEDK